jgi:hypothetical protein
VEQAFDDTQPVLSLQTADDLDLDMDADLQEDMGPLDEVDETDNSGDDAFV